MATQSQGTVVGVFTNHSQAQQAIQALRSNGFTESQIGVASAHSDGLKQASGNDAGDESYASEGAATGLAAGAGVGALWGLGILAGALPAIGPAIAGGTLAAILSSAAAGAAAAGLGGALVGMGISKDEADYYESELHSGRTVVTVNAGNRAAEAKSLLIRNGAYDSTSRGQSTRSSAASSVSSGASNLASSASNMMTGHSSSSTTSNTMSGQSCPSTGSHVSASTSNPVGNTVRAHEEKLHVEKTPVKTGEVTVHKEVHTEHKTIDVPVTREEVVIERRPVSGQAVSGGMTGGVTGKEEIRIPVSEERVSVEKQTVVKEEVSIGKRKVQETEHVSADVKSEEIKVDTKGDAKVRGRKS